MGGKRAAVQIVQKAYGDEKTVTIKKRQHSLKC
jgi:hypothetical protein